MKRRPCPSWDQRPSRSQQCAPKCTCCKEPIDGPHFTIESDAWRELKLCPNCKEKADKFAKEHPSKDIQVDGKEIEFMVNGRTETLNHFNFMTQMIPMNFSPAASPLQKTKKPRNQKPVTTTPSFAQADPASRAAAVPAHDSVVTHLDVYTNKRKINKFLRDTGTTDDVVAIYFLQTNNYIVKDATSAFRCTKANKSDHGNTTDRLALKGRDGGGKALPDTKSDVAVANPTIANNEDKLKQFCAITGVCEEAVAKYYLQANNHSVSDATIAFRLATEATIAFGRRKQDEEEMANSAVGKSFLAANDICALAREEQAKQPAIHVITEEGRGFMVWDLVEMLKLQKDYIAQGASGHVDIGFHYTDAANLHSISRHGLMSKNERSTKNVSPSFTSGAVFGDGIYTANNPTEFRRYGDTGLIVARLQGKAVRSSSPMKRPANAVFNTVIGDKRAGTGTSGWPNNDRHHEIVLQSKVQCVPLIQYTNKITRTSEGVETIQNVTQSLQKIMDKYINEGNEPLDIKDVAMLHQSTSVNRQKLQYDAPQDLSPNEKDTFTSPVQSCVLSENCAICLEALAGSGKCVALKSCKRHVFHHACIKKALKGSSTCPQCRVPVGEPQGKSPSGTMTISSISRQCSGFEEDSVELNKLHIDSFEIHYTIPQGLQLSYHDNPGTSHSSKEVTAYLPNNKDGRDLLKRLKYAFMHGLTFTVGASMTTGMSNQCTVSILHFH